MSPRIIDQYSLELAIGKLRSGDVRIRPGDEKNGMSHCYLRSTLDLSSIYWGEIASSSKPWAWGYTNIRETLACARCQRCYNYLRINVVLVNSCAKEQVQFLRKNRNTCATFKTPKKTRTFGRICDTVFEPKSTDRSISLLAHTKVISQK